MYDQFLELSFEGASCACSCKSRVSRRLGRLGLHCRRLFLQFFAYALAFIGFLLVFPLPLALAFVGVIAVADGAGIYGAE